MCIRDRLHPALALVERDAVAGHEQLGGLLEAEPRELELLGVPVLRALEQPVSYTHLRDHETVLELVCRLMLEKKKKTKEE